MTNKHTNTDAPRSITMSEVMTPDMANFRGNVHGGHLMRLLDQVAYACATRYAGKSTVTLSVDQIFFKSPVHVGDLVTCKATVNYVGRTSMEVGIRVTAENLMTRTCVHTNTCYFTMVAVDDDGKPCAVSAFTPQTDEEKRRFSEAQQRKKLRLQQDQSN